MAGTAEPAAGHAAGGGEGSAAPGCAGSSGMAGLIIHLPNFSVPRHTPHAAAHCLGFNEIAGVIFFLKNGVWVVFECLGSSQGDRSQSSVRRAGWWRHQSGRACSGRQRVNVHRAALSQTQSRRRALTQPAVMHSDPKCPLLLPGADARRENWR